MKRRSWGATDNRPVKEWAPIETIPTVYEIAKDGPPPVEATHKAFEHLNDQVVIRRPDCRCESQKCRSVWHGFEGDEKCLHQRLRNLLGTKDVADFETLFRPLFEMGLHGWCEILPPERLHDALDLYRQYGTPAERVSAMSVTTFVNFERTAWTLRLRIAPCKNSMKREIGSSRKLWERYTADPSGMMLKQDIVELKQMMRRNAPAVGAIFTEIVERMKEHRTTLGIVHGVQ